MTSVHEREVIELDPEIEQTLLRRLREAKKQKAMEEHQVAPRNPTDWEEAEYDGAMEDYVKPSLRGLKSSIVRPSITANSFRIDPVLI